MKKALIVGLLCVNVALVLTLVLGSNVSPAKAQAVRGGTDYIMATGRLTSTSDAIYVLDLGGRKLGAFRLDKTQKKLAMYKLRDLARDFKRKPER